MDARFSYGRGCLAYFSIKQCFIIINSQSPLYYRYHYVSFGTSKHYFHIQYMLSTMARCLHVYPSVLQICMFELLNYSPSSGVPCSVADNIP
jgi:hypothetical protein